MERKMKEVLEMRYEKINDENMGGKMGVEK